ALPIWPARVIRSPGRPVGESSAESSTRAPYTPPNSFPTRRRTGGDRRENKATRQSGQGLADQRTAECRALGGSRGEWPGRPENGAEGSRESCPPEGRYKANLPFALLGRGSMRPTKGGRLRYYVGVDWADQTHAVWVVDER